MEVGDRVTPKCDSLASKVGTVLAVNGQNIGVKWDKDGAEIMQRDRLYIVGHDPKVSDGKGVWHEREKESVRLCASFNGNSSFGR